MRLAAAALLACCLSAGRAAADETDQASPGLIVPGGLVLFYDSSGTLSYPSATLRDIPTDAKKIGEVKGKACQYKLDIPFLSSIGTLSGAAGRGGYEHVYARMHAEHPALRGIYDVKVDDHSITLLGFFERLCTEVTAYGFE